jgi:CheY-like chemotaxis protein
MTEAPETTRKEVPQQGRRPEDITVLIVDDEVDITKYLGTVLSDAGMNVLIAHSGDDALDLLEDQVPDLISLDLVMPGKSGIRVMVELRKNRNWSRIPVIIVTAHARDPKVQRDMSETLAGSTMVGPSLYLEKPVTAQSYLRSICEVLGVDAEIPEPMFGDSSELLRDEARQLLDNADPATLEAVLGRLRAEGEITEGGEDP